MSAVGHSLPSRSAPGPTDVRYGPKATFQGKCPNGREVPGGDTSCLFDHFVGAEEKGGRHFEAWFELGATGTLILQTMERLGLLHKGPAPFGTGMDASDR